MVLKNQIQIISTITKTYLSIFPEAHKLKRPLKKARFHQGFLLKADTNARNLRGRRPKKTPEETQLEESIEVYDKQLNDICA
jgi:hypothetical protein